jgi:hypothetical protein
MPRLRLVSSEVFDRTSRTPKSLLSPIGRYALEESWISTYGA